MDKRHTRKPTCSLSASSCPCTFACSRLCDCVSETIQQEQFLRSSHSTWMTTQPKRFRTSHPVDDLKSSCSTSVDFGTLNASRACLGLPFSLGFVIKNRNKLPFVFHVSASLARISRTRFYFRWIFPFSIEFAWRLFEARSDQFELIVYFGNNICILPRSLRTQIN